MYGIKYQRSVYKDAREWFVMWCNNGKHRQGWIFDLMRQTRSQFKYALRTVNTLTASCFWG